MHYLLLTYALVPIFTIVHALRLNSRQNPPIQISIGVYIFEFLGEFSLSSKSIFGIRFVGAVPLGSASKGT